RKPPALHAICQTSGHQPPRHKSPRDFQPAAREEGCEVSERAQRSLGGLLGAEVCPAALGGAPDPEAWSLSSKAPRRRGPS
ncbi:hypothetical protein NDU88_003889, partial [Pleurodeles waltl]